MNAGIIITVILFAIAIISLITSFIAYYMTFFSNRKKHFDVYHGLTDEEIEGNERKKLSRTFIDELVNLPYEKVRVKSHDGLTLSARYYHTRDGAPLEIQLHGYKSISLHDFSGGCLEAIKRGYNVLLVDQRAHGESEGNTISFGVLERYDVLTWIEYANERFGADTKIILVGISMGAGTVIMSSSLSLPENVVGIIADCPYSTPTKIIAKVMRDMKLPTPLLLPFVRLGGMLFGGFDISSASPLSALENAKIPILILHGEGDTFVPIEMSEELLGASELVTLVRFAEAGHGLSFVYDNEKYKRALDEFEKKISIK